MCSTINLDIQLELTSAMSKFFDLRNTYRNVN